VGASAATTLGAVSPLVQRLLLAVFVVVDVILVVGAVRHVNGTPPAADVPGPSASASAAGPSASEPEGAGATEQIPYDFAPADAVAMSAAKDGTVVYGSRGRCTDPATTVQVSTDGGADFAPAQTGLTTTLAVRATDASSIAVVGTTSDCDVRQVASSDGGKTWTRVEDVDLWYPELDDPSTVVTPARRSTPAGSCVVTSVSQVTDRSGRVSCADGSFVGSGDDGETWVALGRLDNVRVSTFLTPSAGFALARYNGCAANAFSTTDGGVTWTPGGCISGEPARAIAANSSTLFAVVDEDVYSSTDNGAGWTQP
jgi:hypothetical protein